MTVEFVGLLQPRPLSESHRLPGPGIDPGYVRECARTHEAAGFDRLLVGWNAHSPDGLLMATHAAAHTDRIAFMVAHRTGFVAPTVAARAFATLDQLSGGRAGIHAISGSTDTDQQRDGDWLGKDDRYARTDEYLTIMKAIWAASGPVDHAGQFYRIKGASPDMKPRQPGLSIPIFFGGASDAALEVAARHADIYAQYGETRANLAPLIARVRAAAARHGRSPGFSQSYRPILAPNETLAWERAERIRAQVEAIRGKQQRTSFSVGQQRLLQETEKGDRLDERLYTGITNIVSRTEGPSGNTTALVGTPQQVAEVLAEYFDIGVRYFLLRGFDLLDDVEDYGRELILLTRRLIAERSRIQAATPLTRFVTP
jgi:alkanesulfonate monooxygenase